MLVAFLCLLAVSACDQTPDPDASSEVGSDDPVIDALFAHWDQPGSPGCAMAISRDGEMIYSRGYGYANLDFDIPITPQTVFDIASVTKQFVATSVSLLELDGKLSFDDDVRKYLPELPVYEQPITLRHMVYHTSGLRDYLTLFPLAGRSDYFPISGQQILAMMVRQRALIFLPGEQEAYSNTAYMLLAIVVERVSGKTLGDFVDERVYQPLQMNSSLMYDNLEQVIENRATGYARDGDDVRITHMFNFDVGGDGQMYTTVEDLLRWNAYLHGQDEPPFLDSLMEPAQLNDNTTLSYGKGLYFDDYRGMTMIYHTGSSWGFRSALIHFVEERTDMAILCNDDNVEPYAIALRIADHLFESELAPITTENADAAADENDEAAGELIALPLTGEQLQEFNGSYYSPELDAIYRIGALAGELEIRIEQELPYIAVGTDEDRFQLLFSPAGWSWTETVELEFKRDDEGTVSGFMLSVLAERNIVFEKVDLPTIGDSP